MKTKTDHLPKCIGIIMDGNRRWARQHNLPTLEGHRRGYEKVNEACKWAKEAGVPNVVVYAFSTENWNRSEEEVAYLLDLFRTMIADLKTRDDPDGKVRFIGQRGRFDADIQRGMKEVENMHPHAENTLYVALSYGGRAEILSAVKQVAKLPKEAIDALDEETFAEYLWTKDMPDPDIIIRTSGEHRLSGFLPWQSVYSELFFVSPHWPEFSKEDFLAILEEYANRERRHGK